LGRSTDRSTTARALACGRNPFTEEEAARANLVRGEREDHSFERRRTA
jgi:hypothetical protein